MKGEVTMDNNYNNSSNGHSSLIVAVSILGTILLAGIIFCILFFTGIINLSSNKDMNRTMYVVENAYIRSEPNDTSSILINLSPGASVTYHKDANKVYASVTYIGNDGQYNGYVEKAVLSATRPSVTESSTMYVANVKHSIYFRSAPVEDKSNIICEIPLGTAISFIENTDNVFAKISYNNQEGYVKREYLSASVPQATAPSANSGNTNIAYYMYVANVKNSIYLRSEPVENQSNIICTIPLGTKVGYIEYTNSAFSKIAYNGQYGYAKTEYLSRNSPNSSASVSDSMTVCNVKHSIYLRSEPVENSGNIICEIPVGSQVTYISSGTGVFYKIRWNGYVGYAKSEYLRFN